MKATGLPLVMNYEVECYRKAERLFSDWTLAICIQLIPSAFCWLFNIVLLVKNRCCASGWGCTTLSTRTWIISGNNLAALHCIFSPMLTAYFYHVTTSNRAGKISFPKLALKIQVLKVFKFLLNEILVKLGAASISSILLVTTSGNPLANTLLNFMLHSTSMQCREWIDF